MAIQISGTNVIDNSRNLVNIANATATAATANTYVIRRSDGKICAEGLETSINNAPMGTALCGGILICRASGVGWIVSAAAAQVVRVYNSREDAVIRAQQVGGAGAWFVPTLAQMQNPGDICKSFWSPTCGSSYWAFGPFSTYFQPAFNTTTICAPIIVFNSGTTASVGGVCCGCCLNVRAFRCVTY